MPFRLVAGLSALRRHWVLWLALIALAVSILQVISVSLPENDGRLLYALDDAYIHMAVAKNFTRHGVWGVTQYGFTSSTSSVLWPLLLSGVYAIFGVNEIAPLLLNIVFAALAVVTAYRILARTEASPVFVAAGLLAVIYLTPLPNLIFTGMEHTLHLFLTILFVDIAVNVLLKRPLANPTPNPLPEFEEGTFTTARAEEKSSPQSHTDPQQMAGLMLLATLLPLARYEGLFLVGMTLILLLLRGRFIPTLLIGFLAGLPVTLYGWIAQLNGWYFLPNSLLLKGHPPPDLPALAGLQQAMLNLSETPHMVTLLVGALMLLFLHHDGGGRIWKAPTLWLLLFISVSIAHMQFASFNWFYRYEAYLMAWGLLGVAQTLAVYFPRRVIWRGRGDRYQMALRYGGIALMLIVLGLPAYQRGRDATQLISTAMHDRYLGHYQMAQFVSRYYNNATILLNDIGMVAYYTDARLLDTFGLGSIERLRYQEIGTYDFPQIDEWTRRMDADIAIVQVEWHDISQRLPDDWVEVAQWGLASNIVFGDSRIGFFAIDPADVTELFGNLFEFRETAPLGLDLHPMPLDAG
jgi:hypothetical protein